MEFATLIYALFDGMRWIIWNYLHSYMVYDGYYLECPPPSTIFYGIWHAFHWSVCGS